MGWLKSILQGKGDPPKRTSGASEVDAIFERIASYLKDEGAQNAKFPLSIRTRIERGVNCDEIPGGKGEFGHEYQNPIPVNGPLGEILYLSNLSTLSACPIMFHRIGSKEGIDAFEIVSLDGTMWDILYMDCYHPRKSRKAPSGYVLAHKENQGPFFMGATEYVDGFPRNIQDAARDAFQQWVGVPMRTPALREALEKLAFKRPNVHELKLSYTIASLDISRM